MREKNHCLNTFLLLWLLFYLIDSLFVVGKACPTLYINFPFHICFNLSRQRYRLYEVSCINIWRHTNVSTIMLQIKTAAATTPGQLQRFLLHAVFVLKAAETSVTSPEPFFLTINEVVGPSLAALEKTTEQQRG